MCTITTLNRFNWSLWFCKQLVSHLKDVFPFHAFTVRSFAEFCQTLPHFCGSSYPLVKLLDESFSGAGRKRGQAPCWNRISTVGVLYAHPSPVPSVPPSPQNTKY